MFIAASCGMHIVVGVLGDSGKLLLFSGRIVVCGKTFSGYLVDFIRECVTQSAIYPIAVPVVGNGYITKQ